MNSNLLPVHHIYKLLLGCGDAGGGNFVFPDLQDNPGKVNLSNLLDRFIREVGLVWFYCTSTIVGYLKPNPFLYIYTVLFQTIQFSISIQFSSIWPTDRTLSGATTLDQSGPGNDGNKGVLCIPQNSIITGTSSWDCWTLFERVLPLSREAICIASWPGQGR